MRRGLIVLSAAIAVALLAGVASADTPTRTAAGAPPSADVDDLARVLVVELSGGGLDAEKAGIVYVALNRSRLYKAPIREVIRSLVEDHSEWGAGCKRDPNCDYNRALAEAHLHPAFSDARLFAAAVLAGEHANPIGRRITFCHPDHPHLRRDRAAGSADERRQAAELRRQAAAASGPTRAALYRQANRVERVDSRYAYDPDTRQYLPAWSVDPTVGGAAANPPLTLGSTRFA